MNTFCNDFHGCPPWEGGGREELGGWIANRRGKGREMNQTLDFLY